MRRKAEENGSGSRRRAESVEKAVENGSGFGGDLKRSIVAIFLVMLSVLFLFAFFGAGAKVGGWLDRGAGVSFGWGKWLFPALLSVSALFLLRRRTATSTDVVRLVGSGVVFLSSLGFFHLLFVGDSAKAMLSAAGSGSGGGYVGYGIAYPLLSYAGRGAGSVILSALLLSGIVAAFDVSLINILSWVRERVSGWHLPVRGSSPEKNAGQDDDSESVTDVDAFGESDEQSGAGGEEEEPEEAKGNIGTISFPEDESDDADAEETDEEEPGEEDEESGELVVSKRRKKVAAEWGHPKSDLFRGRSGRGDSGDSERTKQVILETLRYFNISGEMGGTTVGPTVTQYTFSPAFGTRLSKIVSLSSELSQALARHPIRIEAPIPNTSLIGIEVPNATQASVRMRDIVESPVFRSGRWKLPVVLGESVSGDVEVADLESMPHLLIAGRTGSGKSVCINAILLSLLYGNSPEDLELILIDPKRVELSLYNEIPHLKGGKVITESKHVVNALKYAIGEMERRLRIFESARVRDLGAYREKECRGETYVEKNGPEGRPRRVPMEPIPYLVIVIDEMADLMMSHGKEVEGAIARLAQMSRAAGIHLVLATQKPIADVVTGLIKSNVPAKIAFAVSSQMDSRIILDVPGANQLIGKGDMLYAAPGASRPKRIQGVYVDDREVRDIVRFFVDRKKELGEENLDEDFTGDDSADAFARFSGEVDFSESADDPNELDDKYDEAKALVIESGRAATTFLQRRLSIGYGRAAKLLDILEENGVVGPPEGANKGRPVLVGSSSGSADHPEYDDPISDQAERDKWQV